MRSRRAFTLVEMVITLCVFVLLSAAIFGIITGVLQSASSLQENQNRTDQTVALQAFLKKKLSGLPGQATLFSYRRGDGEGLDQNGIIFGSGSLLTAIDAKIQPNGLYLLRLTTFSADAKDGDPITLFTQLVTGNDGALPWVSLIHDVQRVDWKFLATNSTQWVDLWSNAASKPNLIELSIQSAGDLRPTVMDFWVPPIFASLLPETSHVL